MNARLSQLVLVASCLPLVTAKTSAGLLDLDFTTNVGSAPLQEGFTPFAVEMAVQGDEGASSTINPQITVGDVTFRIGGPGMNTNVAAMHSDEPYSADDGLGDLRSDYLVIPKWPFFYPNAHNDDDLTWSVTGLAPNTMHTLTFYLGDEGGVFVGSVEDPVGGGNVGVYEIQPQAAQASLTVSSDDQGVIRGDSSWDGGVGSFWAGFSVDLAVNYSFQADFNDDGTVDLLDLDILGRHFGLDQAPVPGDANQDGVVNLLDLDILGAEFGQTAARSVPEPSTALLALVGCCIGVRRLTARR